MQKDGELLYGTFIRDITENNGFVKEINKDMLQIYMTLTYVAGEDTFFKGSSLTDREFMRRVPVYGVNKLSDMHNLSTDLVYSTMQYAAMSLNVRGMATTAAVLLNGVDILKERTINIKLNETEIIGTA